MFAMSISLPNGTVPRLPTTGLCGTRHCVRPAPTTTTEEAGGVLCPASFADPMSAVCLPQAGSKELPLPLPTPAPQGAS